MSNHGANDWQALSRALAGQSEPVAGVTAPAPVKTRPIPVSSASPPTLPRLACKQCERYRDALDKAVAHVQMLRYQLRPLLADKRIRKRKQERMQYHHKRAGLPGMRST